MSASDGASSDDGSLDECDVAYRESSGEPSGSESEGSGHSTLPSNNSVIESGDFTVVDTQQKRTSQVWTHFLKVGSKV